MRSPSAPNSKAFCRHRERACVRGARRYAKAHPGNADSHRLLRRGDKDMPILQRTVLEGRRAEHAASRQHIRGDSKRRSRPRPAGAGRAISPPDFRPAAVQGQSRRRRGVAMWLRSACRSAIRWPTAPRFSARAFAALADGVTLPWIIEELAIALPRSARRPFCLMSYLNPLLSVWARGAAARRGRGRRLGFIVPDLPYEESERSEAGARARGLGAGADGDAGDAAGAAGDAVPRELQGFRVCGDHDRHHRQARGKGSAEVPDEVLDYMDRVKRCSSGSGVRGLRHPLARAGRALCAARGRRGGRLGAGGNAGARRGCAALLGSLR
jgi:hypothetical protein